MKSIAYCLIPIFVSIMIQENALYTASFQSISSSSSLRLSSAIRLSRRRQEQTISFFRLNIVKGDDNDGSKDDFWQQQRDLMKEMSDSNEQSLKVENGNYFDKIQNELIVETVFFTALIFAGLWLACENPFVPFSYIFGATLGIAYTYGLGKYVSTIGGTIDDVSAVQGAGVGQARFAFLILLIIFVGKYRAYGLLEIPSIMGFFTYQLSSLSQGLKEDKID